MKNILKLILISPLPLFFLFVLPWYLQRFDGKLPKIFPVWTQPLGIVLFLPGLFLAGWAIYLFLTEGKGTPAPFAPPQNFVLTGPFQYVRNPMALGFFAMILGEALLWFTSTTILIYLFLLIIFVLVFVSIWEEPDLERRFGESYREYKKNVPRWLPKIKIRK